MICSVSNALYEETLNRLLEAIDGRSYFSGAVAFRFGPMPCRLVVSCFVRRAAVERPEGAFSRVCDLLPVWWEFHTFDPEAPADELLNDFSFNELRALL